MRYCSYLLLLLLLLLPACTVPEGDPSLDLPLYGGEETRFVMAPSDGVVRLRDAAAIAKVLRKYRDITAAEQALVKLAVRRHIDGLVALEYQRLERAAAPERARIKGIANAAQRAREDAALTERLQAEAARRVAALMDGLLAVPLRTTSNQSVVSFAKVVSDDIRVADAAYELSSPAGQAKANATVAVNAGADPELKKMAGREEEATVIATAEPIRID